MLEIPWGNDRDTDRQNSAAISRPVSPRFALGISATTRAENSGGWIGKNKNSDGEHKRSQNGCSCMGRFVRYHVVTVNSKMGIKETGCKSMDLTHLAQDGVQLGGCEHENEPWCSLSAKIPSVFFNYCSTERTVGWWTRTKFNMNQIDETKQTNVQVKSGRRKGKKSPYLFRLMRTYKRHQKI
jgi:hypothetical protein